MVKILTVDPSNRKIEGALKDGGIVHIATFDADPVFVWPREGEYWTVRKDSGIWKLDKRLDTYDDHKIDDLNPGEAKIYADTITTKSGKNVVAVDDSSAINNQVLSFVDGEWVLANSYDGAVGPQGPQGEKGDQGDTGPRGLPGVDGTNGINGTNGSNGATGPTGAIGPQGVQGPQGDPGGVQNVSGTNGISVTGTTYYPIVGLASGIITAGNYVKVGVDTYGRVVSGSSTIFNSDIAPAAGIDVSKLAYSTISGVSLGGNLTDLTSGAGISTFSYNGSASKSIAIDNGVVATLSDNQILINKTLDDTSTYIQNVSGVQTQNTLSKIPGTITGTFVDKNGVTQNYQSSGSSQSGTIQQNLTKYKGQFWNSTISGQLYQVNPNNISDGQVGLTQLSITYGNVKKFKFDAASITVGATRTLTIPDASGTIALQSYADALTPSGTPGFYTIPNGGSTATTIAMSSNTAYAIRFTCPSYLVAAKALFNVTSSNTGGLVDISIFDATGTTRIATGQISTATTGVKTATFGTATILRPGVTYWLNMWASVAATTVTAHTPTYAWLGTTLSTAQAWSLSGQSVNPSSLSGGASASSGPIAAISP